MQLIRDIYAVKQATKQPVVSFEFFPPKTDEGDRNLLERHIPALLQAKPDFCSVREASMVSPARTKGTKIALPRTRASSLDEPGGGVAGRRARPSPP